MSELKVNINAQPKQSDEKIASKRKSFEEFMRTHGYGLSSEQVRDCKIIQTEPADMLQFFKDVERGLILYNGQTITQEIKGSDGRADFYNVDFFIYLSEGADVYNIDQKAIEFYLNNKDGSEVSKELKDIEQYALKHGLIEKSVTEKKTKKSDLDQEQFDFLRINYSELAKNIDIEKEKLGDILIPQLAQAIRMEQNYRKGAHPLNPRNLQENIKDIFTRRNSVQTWITQARHSDENLQNLSNGEILQEVLKNRLKPILDAIRNKMKLKDDVSDSELVRHCRVHYQSVTVPMLGNICVPGGMDQKPFELLIGDSKATALNWMQGESFTRILVARFSLTTEGAAAGELPGLKYCMEHVKGSKISEDFGRIPTTSIIFLDSLSQELFERGMKNKEKKASHPVEAGELGTSAFTYVHVALVNGEKRILYKIAVAREMGESEEICGKMLESLKSFTKLSLEILNNISKILKEEDNNDRIIKKINDLVKKYSSNKEAKNILSNLLPVLPYTDDIAENILNNFQKNLKESFEKIDNNFKKNSDPFYKNLEFIPSFSGLLKATDTLQNKTIKGSSIRIVLVEDLSKLDFGAGGIPKIVLKESKDRNQYDAYFALHGTLIRVEDENFTIPITLSSEEQGLLKENLGRNFEFTVGKVSEEKSIETRILNQITDKFREGSIDLTVEKIRKMLTIDDIRACIFTLSVEDGLYKDGCVSDNTKIIIQKLLHIKPESKNNLHLFRKKCLVADAVMAILFEIAGQSSEMQKWASGILTNKEIIPLALQGREKEQFAYTLSWWRPEEFNRWKDNFNRTLWIYLSKKKITPHVHDLYKKELDLVFEGVNLVPEKLKAGEDKNSYMLLTAQQVYNKWVENCNDSLVVSKASARTKAAKGIGAGLSLSLIPFATEGLARLFDFPTSFEAISSLTNNLIASPDIFSQLSGYAIAVGGSIGVGAAAAILLWAIKSVWQSLAEYRGCSVSPADVISFQQTKPEVAEKRVSILSRDSRLVSGTGVLARRLDPGDEKIQPVSLSPDTAPPVGTPIAIRPRRPSVEIKMGQQGDEDVTPGSPLTPSSSPARVEENLLITEEVEKKIIIGQGNLARGEVRRSSGDDTGLSASQSGLAGDTSDDDRSQEGTVSVVDPSPSIEEGNPSPRGERKPAIENEKTAVPPPSPKKLATSSSPPGSDKVAPFSLDPGEIVTPVVGTTNSGSRAFPTGSSLVGSNSFTAHIGERTAPILSTPVITPPTIVPSSADSSQPAQQSPH